jgi:hypothetical protein
MADLLSILQAHGQQFVNSFSLPPPNGNKRKAKEEHSGPHTKIHKLEHHESEEWLGFCEEEREVGKGGPDGSLNLSQTPSNSSFFRLQGRQHNTSTQCRSVHGFHCFMQGICFVNKGANEGLYGAEISFLFITNDLSLASPHKYQN